MQAIAVRVTARRRVNAPLEIVFDRARQLDRMPERSPEAQRFELLNGTLGEPGAAFRGWNRAFGLSWWTNGWIIEVDEPRRFVFETSTIYGDRQAHTNRWEYRFDDDDGSATFVTEVLQTLRLPIHLKLMGPFLGLRWLQIKFGMVRTLDRLAKECEAISGT